MKISVLSSGSKGNSTFIGTEKANILIDIGLSCSYIEKKLDELDIDPHTIEAVIVTHTHIDHIAGLRVFCKKYSPKVFMTKKMFEEIRNQNLIKEYIEINENFIINDLEIEIIKTSHDTEDSNGYIIKSNNKSIVYITDTGYINIKTHSKLTNHTIYVLESNHDIELLMNGTRPHHIKQRILSDKGHLSNKQASEYLAKFCGDKTEYIVLAHLSHDHNNSELAYRTLIKYLSKNEKQVNNIIIAKQDEKTEVIEV